MTYSLLLLTMIAEVLDPPRVEVRLDGVVLSPNERPLQSEAKSLGSEVTLASQPGFSGETKVEGQALIRVVGLRTGRKEPLFLKIRAEARVAGAKSGHLPEADNGLSSPAVWSGDDYVSTGELTVPLSPYSSTYTLPLTLTSSVLAGSRRSKTPVQTKVSASAELVQRAPVISLGKESSFTVSEDGTQIPATWAFDRAYTANWFDKVVCDYSLHLDRSGPWESRTEVGFRAPESRQSSVLAKTFQGSLERMRDLFEGKVKEQDTYTFYARDSAGESQGQAVVRRRAPIEDSGKTWGPVIEGPGDSARVIALVGKRFLPIGRAYRENRTDRLLNITVPPVAAQIYEFGMLTPFGGPGARRIAERRYPIRYRKKSDAPQAATTTAIPPGYAFDSYVVVQVRIRRPIIYHYGPRGFLGATRELHVDFAGWALGSSTLPIKDASPPGESGP